MSTFCKQLLLLSFFLSLYNSVVHSRNESNEPDTAKAASFKVNGCLLLSALMKIHITKSSSDEISESVFTTYINSTNAKSVNSSGICMNSTGEEYNVLNLDWQPIDSIGNWSISFNFSQTQPAYYGLTSVYLSYWLDKWGPLNASTDKSLFSCAIGSSFICVSEQTFELKDKSSNSTNIRFTFSQFQVEAFRSNSTDNTTFTGPTTSCSADYVPTKVIPIVVGVLLVIMIAAALIAFIISSRRRQVGYEEI
uniref:Lysosome-associated membrane glycoprotein n=1 Tax=Schistosoma japonicum TaxID=6182 RepID=Q5C005_SCHJA|nr:unknown [Schistosoma japonicum]